MQVGRAKLVRDVSGRSNMCLLNITAEIKGLHAPSNCLVYERELHVRRQIDRMPDACGPAYTVDEESSNGVHDEPGREKYRLVRQNDEETRARAEAAGLRRELWGSRARTRSKRCFELVQMAALHDKLPEGAVIVLGNRREFCLPHNWIELPGG